MKILVDIGHPAHVHFFSHPIKIWRKQGVEIIITSRRKEMATDLLDSLGVNHQVLSTSNSGNAAAMFRELLQRDLALLKVVRKEKPDIMTGIAGVFISHVGLLTRTPSIVFYDTENATLSNAITYPFASVVAAPECYRGWLPRHNIRYPGYHELSYLHPNRFTPNRGVAIKCGLDPEKPTFLLRTVSWQANHDLSETGWSLELLEKLSEYLGERGKVIISAEGKLPSQLEPQRYEGTYADIHHLMGHLALFVGESATMASECAVLGIPAIYAANTGRGYTDEQEKKFSLVKNIRRLGWDTVKEGIDTMLSVPDTTRKKTRHALLEQKIDVAPFVAELVSNYPASLTRFRELFKGS